MKRKEIIVCGAGLPAACLESWGWQGSGIFHEAFLGYIEQDLVSKQTSVATPPPKTNKQKPQQQCNHHQQQQKNSDAGRFSHPHSKLALSL